MVLPKTSNESLLFLSDDSSKIPPSVSTFCKSDTNEKSYWFHFSIDNPTACKWLSKKSGVDPLIAETMLSEKVRPRFVEKTDSLLLILRVADTLDISKHEELRSIRIYADKDRIISTSLVPLPVIKELLDKWKKIREGIEPVDLFMDLTIQSVQGLEALLDDLDDRMDTLEKQTLDSSEEPTDHELTSLSLDSLNLRGCLSPQREVFALLSRSNVSWIDFTQKNKVFEVYEKVSRQLAETEVLRDRARIIRNQINSRVAEQVNQRLYIFSMVAVIFLPLGFLTGLLGVNLGGIPGGEHPFGFYLFCGGLTLLAAITIMTFRRYEWL